MKRMLPTTLMLLALCTSCASSSPAEKSSEQAASSEVSEQPEADVESEADDEETESSEEPEADAKTVTLRFDWPAQLDGEARVASEKKIDVPGEPENIETKQGTYDADIEQNVKGHLDISFEHASLAASQMPEDEEAKEAYFLKRYKMLWMPSFRVSKQTGAITEVLNMDRLRAGHEAMLDHFAPEDEEESKRFRAAMAGMSPDKVAMNLATKRWNLWVAFWQGAELEIGASYELEQPGTPKVVFSAVQMVPCDTEANAFDDVTFDESVPRDCVELFIEQPLPEQALLAAMNPVVAALDEDGDTTFDSVSGTDWTSVICDPDTLIPYSVENLRKMEMQLTVDGKSATASIEGTESVEFDWKNDGR